VVFQGKSPWLPFSHCLAFALKGFLYLKGLQKLLYGEGLRCLLEGLVVDSLRLVHILVLCRDDMWTTLGKTNLGPIETRE